MLGLENIGVWILFNAFVIFLLLLDLLVFHRRAKEVNVRDALILSAGWIILALLFNVGVWALYGQEKGLTFLSGYLIEKSLSVDNLFVFVLIFAHFRVPADLQHKVLFFGILGALVMRLLFIFLGITLLEKFAALVYILGAVLVISGAKFFFSEPMSEENGPRVLGFFRRGKEGEDMPRTFWTRRNGRLRPTRLLTVVLAVEAADLIFAVDSIPAILAISDDPFIIYSSNVFAILGLRSLYFALAGLMKLFQYLDEGVGAILVFIGCQMMLKQHYEIPESVTLVVIFSILSVAITASILKQKKERQG